MVFLVSATATATVEYGSYSMVLGLSMYCVIWRKMCSLGYLLVLVMLLESLYLAKVMMLEGGCVSMVG